MFFILVNRSLHLSHVVWILDVSSFDSWQALRTIGSVIARQYLLVSIKEVMCDVIKDIFRQMAEKARAY